MWNMWKRHLIWAAIVLSASIILFTFGKERIPIDKPTQLDLACDPNKETAIQRELSKWIYDHSARISKRGCAEIVFEARKTKRSLLIIAIIAAESEYNQTAVSSKGAIGLTQVMPGVWEKHLISKNIIKERRDLFDIDSSVAAGNEVLGICLKDANGDVAKALDRYLGGQDGVYVKRILNNLANLYLLMEGIK